MSAGQHRRRAFTLTELLVVIAIIGLLMSILLPAVQAAREAARRSQCANNLKQLGLGQHSYHNSYKKFTPGGTCLNETSWHVHILPFIEQEALYDQFNFSRGVFTSGGVNQDGRNGLAVRNRVAAFLCPSSYAERMLTGGRHSVNVPELIANVPPYTTHYYGVMGPKGTNPAGNVAYGWLDQGANGGFALQGIFDRNSKTRIPDITDGTSNSLMLGEISWVNESIGSHYRSWMRGCNVMNPETVNERYDWMAGCKNVAAPINMPLITHSNDIPFGSHHPGGTHFSVADGSVRFLSQSIDMPLYRGLASRNGRESAAMPD